MSTYGGEDMATLSFHESFATETKRQIPEVEQVARWTDGIGEVVLQSDEAHRFKEKNIGFADASLLSLMGVRLLSGDAKTALSEPGHIVLNRRLAEKYFGAEDAVGKTLLYDKKFPLLVSAVLDDLPTNSIFQFNGLVSLNSMPMLGVQAQQIYQYAGFLQTFLILKQGTEAKLVEQKLEKVKAGIQFVNLSAKFSLESLSSLHLDSRSTAKDNPRQTLYILLTIALFILVLAVVNYVSLTTARATQRSREVGVRKAIGGQRRELIGQFFLESFLTTTLAFVLSLVLLQAIFPWASQSLDLPLDVRLMGQPAIWGLMLVLWLGCSLLAGAYPALLLSGFRPAVVLKGGVGSRLSGAGLRQVFTTVQFTACIGLLICSFVLYAQMKFLRTKNLGINRAQVVAISLDGDMVPQYAALRDALRQWAGPQHVAATNTRLFSSSMMTWYLKTQKTEKQLLVSDLTVDKPFFKLMNVQWKYPPTGWEAGPVTRELRIYNETVIKEAGIESNPLQQPAPFKNQPTDGVVADFKLGSLHEAIAPMKLSVVSDTSRSFMENGGYLLVKLNARTDVPKALGQLKSLYEAQQPTAPFDYYFLDDAYNKLYAKEDRLAQLFNAFTGLTLLVACLGLLGLMTFNVEARTKEIGIRKVLGATVASIVALLSKDFLKLVLIAIVIASPIAWYAMNEWLQDFAYKIDIEWWVFALAGGLAVGIALLTVSFQSVKAALMNPVESLRSE